MANLPSLSVVAVNDSTLPSVSVSWTDTEMVPEETLDEPSTLRGAIPVSSTVAPWMGLAGSGFHNNSQDRRRLILALLRDNSQQKDGQQHKGWNVHVIASSPLDPLTQLVPRRWRRERTPKVCACTPL